MTTFFDAFISYGRADSKAFATKLYTQLKEQGLKIWFDQNDIPLGVDFQNQIDEGIEKSHNFLFIIAPHSVNSPYCLKEIELAITRNKRIIPLLHVMQISQEIWQQRNPNGTGEDWEAYKAKGLHESYQNMHPTIRKLNWVYFQEGIDDFDKSLAGLLEIVERQRTYVYQHTYFLDKALEWQRNQKQSCYLLSGEECQKAEAWLNVRFKDQQSPCVPTDEHCEFITESIKHANHLMTQVFLSHAEQDKAVTEKIRRMLIRHGFTVWTNRTDIKTGTEFQEVINRGIEEADNLVYLISPNSLKSQYCQQELAYASKLNKHIIPLLIEPTDLADIPPEQRSLQFIDFTEHKDENKYRTVADKLLNVLKEEAWYYELHKILLVKALKWERKDQPKTLLLKGSELVKAQNWLKQSEQSHKQTAATSLHKAFIAASKEMNQFFDVFISYGRADSLDFAIKLHARLVEQGFNVWFDKEEIPLGVDYQKQIDDGIEKAHNFLYIIAPHSINSPYCGKEIELALKRNKRIIPLLHVEQITQETWQRRNPVGKPEDWEAYKAKGLHTSFQNMHPEISKINWVYFREQKDDFEASLTGLLELCERQQEYVQQHTYFLAKALEWERNQKQSRYLLIGDERKQAEAWLNIRFKDEQAPCLPTDLHSEFITESIKNGNNLMTQVFLAHAEEDSQVMDRIRKSLWRECFTVWTNKTDIQTGEAFEDAIKRGIEQADNVVYLLSPDSLNSQYCQQELEYALLLNKRIIPILVRETPPEGMPPVLRGLHYIDLTDNVREEDYQLDESQLLKILRQDAPYYNEHKVLLTKALKWERQHRNPSILLRGYNLDHAKAWLKEAKLRKQHLPTALQEELIAESLRQPSAISLDVFVSYSRADSDFARKLNDALQMQGKTTWFDQESIASGADFQEEIYRGIESADNFLFILSPRSVNSPYCKDEVEYAAKLNKRFVTVLHRQVNPASLHPELAKVQWIDFNQNEKDFSANFSQLIRTLDTDREHLRNHTKWSHRAIEWQEKNKSDDLLLRGSEFVIAENWLQEAEQQKKQPAATPLQKDYIAKSRDAILAGTKQEKRRVIILRSLLGLVSVALVVAVVQYREAQQERVKAQQQSSITKATLIKNLLATHPLEALVRAIEATGASESSLHQVPREVQSSLFEAVQVARKGVIERHILRFDGGYILSVAFSPDGQIIASGDRLWDLKGNPISQPFRGHEGGILSVVFSPDGKTIVTGSDDKTVRLWDLKGNPIGQPFRGHNDRVSSVAFSPDGKTIISGSWDKTVRLWDLKGKPIGQPFREHGGYVTSVAISRDGKTIVSGSEDKTLRLWDLKGKPIGQPFRGHDDRISSVAFSPDGKTIISGSWDKTVRLWDLKGKPIGQPFRGHGGYVTSVAISWDGKTIVSSSNDNTVWSWDLKGNPIGQPFRGHRRFVTSVAISPDGAMIVSGGEDSTVRLWDLKSLLTNQPVQKHEQSVTSVAFSPDGKYIISGCYDGKVRLWDRKGNLIGRPFQGHKLGIRSVAFSPDGQMIASGSEDKTVRLWDLKGNPIGQPFQGHEDIVFSVAFSPDGRMIASGSKDKTVRLWDLKGNPIDQPLRGHQDTVKSVVFSPDGKTIASSSDDKTIRLWDLKGNPIGKPFQSRDGRVWSVAFSPDGQSIASGNDGTVQLWDLKGNFIDKPFKGHEGGVFSVAFSPNGKTIASSGEDNTLRLWDLKGNPIGEPLKGHEGGVWSVAFSPDGQSLASGSWDYTMRLWQGVSWQDWLQIGCNRLRAHSVFVEPKNDIVKAARSTCQTYVWEKGKSK
jgi:WD40 repeat protein